MSCDCPLNSPMLGSEELLIVARGAAATCYVILAACLWQLYSHRSTVWNFLQNKNVVAVWKRMREKLAWPWFAVADEHTVKVREVMAKLHEDRCGTVLHFCLCWSVIASMFAAYRMHVAGVWSNDVDMDTLRDALLGTRVLRQITVAAVAVMCPVLSKAVHAQVVHVAFVVSSICVQWQQTALFQERIADIGNVSGHIFFAAVLGRPLPTLMLSAAMLGSTVVRSLGSDELLGVSDARFLGATFAVLCALLSQKIMQSEARAVVAAMTSASSEAAVTDLLGIMCDAVVVLDERLVIASPCPRLDALLLRRAPENGGAFPSLFHFTDQDRVVQFLAGCDGVAQSLHAHLQDVRGSRLGVQLFHKRFEDVFGKTRHVIGVQEEPDDALTAQLSVEDDPEAQWPFGLAVGSSSSHQILERSGMHRSGNSSNGDSSGSGSSSSSGLVPLRRTDRDDPLELQIDTASQNLRILSCTASVTGMIGTVEHGIGFLNVVAASDKAPLLRWVEEGGTDPKRVTLQHKSIQSVTYRATCIIRDDDQVPAARCLVLSNVRCRFRDSGSGRRTRRTDTRGTERRVTRRISL